MNSSQKLQKFSFAFDRKSRHSELNLAKRLPISYVVFNLEILAMLSYTIRQYDL